MKGKTGMDKARLNFFIEKAINLAGVIFYGFLAYDMLISFIVAHRLSSLVFLIMESVVIYFFLTRDMPRQTSMRPYDWFIALAGSYLPLLLRPAGGVQDVSLFLSVQLTGTVASILAILFLNSSFGLVAANRGIKKGGLYKYVRHPIYAGYIITYTGFILQNMCLWNGVILFSVLIFLLLRVIAEEEFLAKDPAYAEYMAKTRWRLFPYVF
ncbi:MAG: methyltransferase [Pseudomonadota bacterium]